MLSFMIIMSVYPQFKKLTTVRTESSARLKWTANTVAPQADSNHNLNSTSKEIFEQLVEITVLQYMRFHKANRFRPGARKLIYTGMGNKHGLGDRFRGILHAYLCALLSDRVLLLAWSDPFPLETVFRSAPGTSVMFDAAVDHGRLPPNAVLTAWKPLPFSRAHDFPWCDCTLPSPGILLSSHRAVVIRTEATPNLRRLLLALQAHSSAPLARRLVPALERWAKVSHGNDDVLYSRMFRALLRPTPTLLGRLAGLHKEIREMVPERAKPFRRGGHRGFLSVHARLGYGVGEDKAYAARFNLAKKGASIRLVAKCLAAVSAKEADDVDLPDPQAFYIAGDTPELSQAFREEIDKRNRGGIVMEIGGEKVHSSKMNSTSAKDKDKFLMTVVDLFFLSAGEKLVSLPSGFANLAHYFGAIPHRTVRVEDCVQIAKYLD